MTKQFKEGVTYTGEMMHGSCQSWHSNSITVLKRTSDSITYHENYGQNKGTACTAPIEKLEDWGEFITIGEDRFFAYSVEGA